ncbi:MAG: hypothetical protein DMG78_24340, partial [Acidobacteria bacterium]
IGIFIDCVGPDLLQRSGEAKIYNAYVGNLGIAQVQLLHRPYATRWSGRTQHQPKRCMDFYS